MMLASTRSLVRLMADGHHMDLSFTGRSRALTPTTPLHGGIRNEGERTAEQTNFLMRLSIGEQSACCRAFAEAALERS